MNGVLCLGEALIDFIPLDPDNLTYQKSPGGAPANVSVGIAKLGGTAAFLGKAGNDVLGQFLHDTLKGYGVNTCSMIFTEEARTGVTFVTLEPSGERHFSFYINPSADSFLQKEEINLSLFEEYKIFHFGSISLIRDPAKKATLHALEIAKEKGLLISYDPNLRLGLWDSEKRAKETILAAIPYADILKVSDEELTFLTGCTNIEEGIAKLPNNLLTLVTLGSEGCIYCFKGQAGKVPALKCSAVDTTGAGDAFVSGILYSINKSQIPLGELSESAIVEMIRFANISGGLATTKKGAMSGLPTMQEIQKLLKINQDN
ncbi:aminoimidazole riboside kinase [Neobacillus mesonae]|uniref:aminoimidazole riboside kinase n=1 Tax=Neobacillus mesonae TaxID=1193713 RepID=UPI00203F6611|nr:aminoimidazole riboside kinase [Neobacillus mesonae]MCM3567039.1 aminoimidazole riboside kinase [Neobacillus mesonae]